MNAPLQSAGWYCDPSGQPRLLWWTGATWATELGDIEFPNRDRLRDFSDASRVAIDLSVAEEQLAKAG